MLKTFLLALAVALALAGCATAQTAKGVPVNVKRDYGAACDGVTNDTAALQRAFNTAGASEVQIPNSVCLYTTLTINHPVRIVGQTAADGTVGSSVLQSTDATTANKITIGDGVTQLYGVNFEHLNFTTPSSTGGAVVFYQFVSDSGMQDVQMVTLGASAYGILGTRLNTLHLTDMRIVNPITSALRFYGGDTTRSDFITLNKVVVSGDALGAHTHIPTGLDIDGFVNTLDLQQYLCVQCGRGIWAHNTVGATQRGEFIISHDTEVDFPYLEAIRIDYHDSMYFVNTYLHGSVTTTDVYIAHVVSQTTSNISFVGGNVTGAALAGMYLDGVYTRVIGVIIGDNSLSSTGSFPGIEIGPDSIATTIEGNEIGQQSGLFGATQNYGIIVDNGAAEWIIVNNDLTGNLTAPFQNLSFQNQNSGSYLGPNQGYGTQPSSAVAAIAPTNGFTITVGPAGGQYNVETMELVPGGTLASGTIVLPNVPRDGEPFRLFSSQTITSLTITPGTGQSVDLSPGTIAANGSLEYLFQQDNSGITGHGRWIRVR